MNKKDNIDLFMRYIYALSLFLRIVYRSLLNKGKTPPQGSRWRDYRVMPKTAWEVAKEIWLKS